jgi:hypothetical protein
VKKGTFSIHMLDPKRHTLVWSGNATSVVGRTAKNKIELLNKVFNKMFKDFPPPPPKE